MELLPPVSPSQFVLPRCLHESFRTQPLIHPSIHPSIHSSIQQIDCLRLFSATTQYHRNSGTCQGVYFQANFLKNHTKFYPDLHDMTLPISPISSATTLPLIHHIPATQSADSPWNTLSYFPPQGLCPCCSLAWRAFVSPPGLASFFSSFRFQMKWYFLQGHLHCPTPAEIMPPS